MLHGLDRSDSNQYFDASANERWRNAVIYLVDLGIEQSLFFSLVLVCLINKRMFVSLCNIS